MARSVVLIFGTVTGTRNAVSKHCQMIYMYGPKQKRKKEGCSDMFYKTVPIALV